LDIVIVIYFGSKKEPTIDNEISRLNRDVAKQIKKLKDPNRNSL